MRVSEREAGANASNSYLKCLFLFCWISNSRKCRCCVWWYARQSTEFDGKYTNFPVLTRISRQAREHPHLSREHTQWMQVDESDLDTQNCLLQPLQHCSVTKLNFSIFSPQKALWTSTLMHDGPRVVSDVFKVEWMCVFGCELWVRMAESVILCAFELCSDYFEAVTHWAKRDETLSDWNLWFLGTLTGECKSEGLSGLVLLMHSRMGSIRVLV